MDRRSFLAASLAGSAAALAPSLKAQPSAGESTQTGTPPSASREFYQLRRYALRSGPQLKLTESYFGEALIPALTRLGMGPIGAFRVEFGPETPTFYLLIPSPSLDAVASIDMHLATDIVFLQAAASFWSAPAASPAFDRVESSLLAAFAGWPKLTPPPASATRAKRIFQLRSYESPSDSDHLRKIEMFHSGEFDIFQRTGCQPVFFSDVLIGPRLPKLTYMLSFADETELDARWDAFRADPAWKKLSSSPRFAFEAIVSNIENLILSPLAASQI